ncbi:MAG: nodulation protein NfeD [Deltaproteobacteria bacterium]|nr:nodulation protein NfeD [Deltaproteobacteria bacterium]
MKKYFFTIIIFLTLPIAISFANEIYMIKVDGVINPATAHYMIESITKAEEDNAEAIIIQLDTPGGLMESMRITVKKILSAKVPVIVYVAPAGSRAASAGVFITLAAHIAVMAPTTHMGAAHPVQMGEKKVDKTMMEKILNDTVAYIKSIARKRGRNEIWAEKTVRESVSITEKEALKLHMIDFISNDVDQLLSQIDKREIKLDGKTKVLKTKGIKIKVLPMSFRYRFLDKISNPNIAYILLLLGIYGIFFELSNPGAIFPGVVGGIFLILAFFALQMLPINYAGLALILLGVIFFIAEIKVISHGLLAVGGTISVLIGSVMLIENPTQYLRISWSVILPAVIFTAIFFLFALSMAIRAHRKKPTTGKEGLVGEKGEARTDIMPEGQVFLHGEIWNAISDESIKKGEMVKVVSTEGLKIKVEKLK